MRNIESPKSVKNQFYKTLLVHLGAFYFLFRRGILDKPLGPELRCREKTKNHLPASAFACLPIAEAAKGQFATRAADSV
ncbi:hypothetical protein ASF12_23220 [Paenibacillus sp. Leaf72]|nr:hypothetical protein ASF12_23220 [Paenibacillus sp. Leaf72]